MTVHELFPVSLPRVFIAASPRRCNVRLFASDPQAFTLRSLPPISAVRKTHCRSVSSAGTQPTCRGSKASASANGERPFSPLSLEGPVPLFSNEESHASSVSQVKWPASGDSRPVFDAIFLRDCCSCMRCVDPSTTQKTFETADIPRNIRAKHVDLRRDGSVHISWDPDVPGFETHTSVYEASFGVRNKSLRSRLEATCNVPGPRVPWHGNILTQNRLSVPYKGFMNQDHVLLSSLDLLHHYGLLFISSVPSDPESVTSLARRIGPLKSTLYGPTWDVKSVPSAKNVAYTSSNLGFHMVMPTAGLRQRAH